jgi:hypothetical protein
MQPSKESTRRCLVIQNIMLGCSESPITLQRAACVSAIVDSEDETCVIEVKGRVKYCVSAYKKITYFLTPKSSDRLQLVMFFIGDAQLRASSSCASPKSFFIGARGQEI